MSLKGMDELHSYLGSLTSKIMGPQPCEVPQTTALVQSRSVLDDAKKLRAGINEAVSKLVVVLQAIGHDNQ